MKQDSRKPQNRRPESRTLPTLARLREGMGTLLLEAIAGLWLGVALAQLAGWLAAPPVQRALSGELLLGRADRLCSPRIGGGPYLDGDRVTLADGSILICDGVAGRWESPAARAQRRSGWDGVSPAFDG